MKPATPPRGRLATLVQRLLAACLAALFALAVAEVAIRWALPESAWQHRDASADWRPDAEAGWVQKPHLDVTTRADQGRLVRFRTNGDGLRPEGARRARTPGTVRVLLFGDSAVVGRAVPAEDAVHAHLTRLLGAAGRRIEVINAGVEGYSTDQVLVRMGQLLPLYRPDVVAYGFCGNDFGGIASRVAYGLAKPSFALEGGRLRRIPPDLRRARALRATGSGGRGPRHWVQASALYRSVRPGLNLVRARLGSWEERNLLGMSSDLYYRPAALEEIDWPLFSRLVSAMAETTRAHGGRFFFYPHPAVQEVWDPAIRTIEKRQGLAPGQYDRHALERRLRQVAAEDAIPFCPVIDRFLERQSEGPFHLLPRDPHCNPAGYRLTAEALAACLREAGWTSGGQEQGKGR